MCVHACIKSNKVKRKKQPGFAYSLTTMVNVRSIQCNSVYKTLIRHRYDTILSHDTDKISYIDAIIKECLIKYYGFRGLLIAMSINETFLLQILVKDYEHPFDLSVNDVPFVLSLMHAYKKKQSINILYSFVSKQKINFCVFFVFYVQRIEKKKLMTEFGIN